MRASEPGIDGWPAAVLGFAGFVLGRAWMAEATCSVAVIGAGINGAAVARELTLSGVNVTVLETNDLACGATAWSTRLVHGGLRYLEYGEIDLVRESLRERERLVNLAGHLVEPLRFCVPLQRRLGGLLAAAAKLSGSRWLAGRFSSSGPRGSWAVGIGLTLYDMLSGGGWPRHQMDRGGDASLPEIDPATYPFAATYVDAQMLYPERFTVELLQDARQVASEHGCRFQVVTHCRVRAEPDGTLCVSPDAVAEAAGVGQPHRFRPDAVINASGAWVDRTRAALPLAADGPQLIGGTKGSHLLVDCPPLRHRLRGSGVYAEADDGRPVFVLPFGERLVLVGTTDLPYEGDPADAVASAEEVEYLREACRQIFPDAVPGHDELLLHYCGVRPLPKAGPGDAPASVTRRHLLIRHHGAAVPSWSVVGGKLTTCRSLAESVAQEVLSVLGRPVRCTSVARPLPGHAAAETAAAREQLRQQLQLHGFSESAAATLLRLYGGVAVSFVTSDGPGRILGACGLPAEVVRRAVADEWAVTLDDVVSRRLMLTFDPDFDMGTLRAIAAELVSIGQLLPEHAEAEVARVRSDLERRHGRRLRERNTAVVESGGEE
jgi:glycerol-3-phosphate dehydrogenase